MYTTFHAKRHETAEYYIDYDRYSIQYNINQYKYGHIRLQPLQQAVVLHCFALFVGQTIK